MGCQIIVGHHAYIQSANKLRKSTQTQGEHAQIHTDSNLSSESTWNCEVEPYPLWHHTALMLCYVMLCYLWICECKGFLHFYICFSETCENNAKEWTKLRFDRHESRVLQSWCGMKSWLKEKWICSVRWITPVWIGFKSYNLVTTWKTIQND